MLGAPQGMAKHWTGVVFKTTQQTWELAYVATTWEQSAAGIGTVEDTVLVITRISIFGTSGSLVSKSICFLNVFLVRCPK